MTQVNATPQPAASLQLPASNALSSLKTGDVIAARVVQQVQPGVVQLNLNGTNINAQALPNLQPGTQVNLQVSREGSVVKLSIVTDGQVNTATRSGVNTTNSLPATQSLPQNGQVAATPRVQTNAIQAQIVANQGANSTGSNASGSNVTQTNTATTLSANVSNATVVQTPSGGQALGGQANAQPVGTQVNSSNAPVSTTAQPSSTSTSQTAGITSNTAQVSPSNVQATVSQTIPQSSANANQVASAPSPQATTTVQTPTAQGQALPNVQVQSSNSAQTSPPNQLVQTTANPVSAAGNTPNSQAPAGTTTLATTTTASISTQLPVSSSQTVTAQPSSQTQAQPQAGTSAPINQPAVPTSANAGAAAGVQSSLQPQAPTIQIINQSAGQTNTVSSNIVPSANGNATVSNPVSALQARITQQIDPKRSGEKVASTNQSGTSAGSGGGVNATDANKPSQTNLRAFQQSALNASAGNKTSIQTALNNLSSIAANSDAPLSEISRVSVARQFNLKIDPPPIQANIQANQNSVTGQANNTANQPPANTENIRTTVSTLLNSLSRSVGSSEEGIPDFIRNAAARLLDAEVPSGKPQSSAQNAGPRIANPEVLFKNATNLLNQFSDKLPANLKTALQGLVERQVSPNQLTTADGVKQAILSSGVFLETNLAQGQPISANGDNKASLLLLRNALQSWLGTDIDADGSGNPATKQNNNQQSGAQRADGSGLDAAARNLAKSVLNQTENALSQIRIAQLAATPDRPDGVGQSQQAAKNESIELHVQIPVLIDGKSQNIQLDIERDSNAEAELNQAVWRVRFFINFDPIGAASAVVSLQDKTIGVKFRAEKQETALLLSNGEDMLKSMLIQAGLEVSEITTDKGAILNLEPKSDHLVDKTT